MSEVETVAQGRSKRSTAGNRMRELLEKAHQEDDDELFKEEADDEEFAAPQDIRDVYLEDFADTDDEVEMDSEAEEKAVRKEERKKAKGKNKAHDPFAPARPKKVRLDPSSSSPSVPSLAAELAELDPTLDASSMAPSALILTIRRKRREQKRQGRSQAIRSTLRASTLRTEQEVAEREKEEREQRRLSRKGRKAQHEGGEVRGVRPMTQDELIAAALEEEERNREALRDWIRKEEEKRELRRVGRKRVRGPRWTFISRTVGSLVEEVPEKVVPVNASVTPAPRAIEATPHPPEPSGEGPTESTVHENPDQSSGGTGQDTPTEQQAEEVVEESRPKESSIQDGNNGDLEQGSASLVQSEAPPMNNVIQDATSGRKESGHQAQDHSAADEAPAVGPSGESSLPMADSAHQPASTDVAETPNGIVESHAEDQVTGTPDVAPEPRPISPVKSTIMLSTARSDFPSPATSTNPPTASNPTIVADSSSIDVAPAPSYDEDIASKDVSGTHEASVTPAPAAPPFSEPAKPVDAKPMDPQQYARNYLILSQIPGGLPEELKIVFGDHIEWNEMKYIPHKNRPINRRPTITPFTGRPAKYRHPETNIAYSSVEEFKQINALLQHRYVWSEEIGAWLGGEEDVAADGAADIPGWREAVHGGFFGGVEIPPPREPTPEPAVEELAPDPEVEPEPEPEPEVEPEVTEGAKPTKGKKGKGGTKVAAAKGKAAAKAAVGKGASGRPKGGGNEDKGKSKSKGESKKRKVGSPPLDEDTKGKKKQKKSK